MKTIKIFLIISAAIHILLFNPNKILGQENNPDSLDITIFLSEQSPLADTSNEWQILEFYTKKIAGQIHYYKSSSDLDRVNPFEGVGKYEAFNLIDRDPNTAWVEGVKGNGVGEYAFISMGAFFPDSIKIRNGYQKTQELYNANSRPKKLKISFYTGYYFDGDVTEIATVFRLKKMADSYILNLQDIMDAQFLKIPFNKNEADILKAENTVNLMETFKDEIKSRADACEKCSFAPEFQYFMKIEIEDVYPGNKWEDCCISDIEWYTTVPQFTRIPDSEKILKIYEENREDVNIIYVITDKNNKIVLADRKSMPEYKDLSENENLDIMLIDVSDDKEWAMINVLISPDTLGVVEEYSTVYYVPELLRLDESIIKTKYGIFGFFMENGVLWLDTADDPVNLDKLKEKIKKN
jgi:hypothetical protein